MVKLFGRAWALLDPSLALLHPSFALLDPPLATPLKVIGAYTLLGPTVDMPLSGG